MPNKQDKKNNHQTNRYIKTSTSPLIDLDKFEIRDGELFYRKEYLISLGKCCKKKCKNCPYANGNKEI